MQSTRDQHASENWNHARSRSGGRERARLEAGARPRLGLAWACLVRISCRGDGARLTKIQVGSMKSVGERERSRTWCG